jgi:hypothetical protein
MQLGAASGKPFSLAHRAISGNLELLTKPETVRIARGIVLTASREIADMTAKIHPAKFACSKDRPLPLQQPQSCQVTRRVTIILTEKYYEIN